VRPRPFFSRLYFRRGFHTLNYQKQSSKARTETDRDPDEAGFVSYSGRMRPTRESRASESRTGAAGSGGKMKIKRRRPSESTVAILD